MRYRAYSTDRPISASSAPTHSQRAHPSPTRYTRAGETRRRGASGGESPERAASLAAKRAWLSLPDRTRPAVPHSVFNAVIGDRASWRALVTLQHFSADIRNRGATFSTDFQLEHFVTIRRIGKRTAALSLLGRGHREAEAWPRTPPRTAELRCLPRRNAGRRRSPRVATGCGRCPTARWPTMRTWGYAGDESSTHPGPDVEGAASTKPWAPIGAR